MKQQEFTKQINVDGAIFTDSAIERIRSFQAANNELLKNHISSIADTICYLELLCGHEIDSDPELVATARLHIGNLIDIREELKLFQKP